MHLRGSKEIPLCDTCCPNQTSNTQTWKASSWDGWDQLKPRTYGGIDRVTLEGRILNPDEWHILWKGAPAEELFDVYGDKDIVNDLLEDTHLVAAMARYKQESPSTHSEGEKLSGKLKTNATKS